MAPQLTEITDDVANLDIAAGPELQPSPHPQGLTGQAIVVDADVPPESYKPVNASYHEPVEGNGANSAETGQNGSAEDAAKMKKKKKKSKGKSKAVSHPSPTIPRTPDSDISFTV